MELFEVLAPNHFSVNVFAQKRRLEYKSKPVNELESEFQQFEQNLLEYYDPDEMNPVLPQSIEIGDMCIIFRNSRPNRCRILSKSKRGIYVYLIDYGVTRKCIENDLFPLDEDFCDFPSRAIEIFVLGIVPTDKNPKWLSDTKEVVNRMMNPLKNSTHREHYLQAQVIRSFDRQLIVKDLHIVSKVRNRTQGKSFAKNLIKCGSAVTAPIKLHDIFMDTPNSSQIDVDQSMGLGSVTPDYINKSTKEMSLTKSTISSLSMDKIACNTVTEQATLENLQHDASINDLNMKETPAITNVTEIHRTREHTVLLELDLMQTERTNQRIENQPPLITVESVPSLDDIFGSSPEDSQTAKILTPIKYNSSDEVDAVKDQQAEKTSWLISFSDDDGETITPSPFANSLINSLDDFL